MSNPKLSTTSSSATSSSDDKLQWSFLSTPKSTVATEDHFQSLGLHITNDLPQFRLNEPGPTAMATSIFQQNNMVNDEAEQSFVVLGKTSLESIRETSAASYMDLQQRSSCIDHTPMLSMMSPSQIEDNLKKVLDENVKLKQTLEQNNIALKVQFNTIMSWQKEVMQTCDIHKRKFEGTKELISHLKKENDELRDKLLENQLQIIPMTNKNSDKTPCSSEISHPNSLIQKTDYETAYSLLLSNTSLSDEYIKLQYSEPENTPSCSSEINNQTTLKKKIDLQAPDSLLLVTSSFPDECNKNNDNMQTNEEKLMKKINILSEELSQMKKNNLETQEAFNELKTSYKSGIEFFNQYINKANKKLELSNQEFDSSNPTELKLMNECCEKDIELKYLKDIISSLEQKISELDENQLPLVDLTIESSLETSSETLSLKENIDFYNSKIGELNKCFASQCSRHLRVKEILKESADIIQVFENAEILSNNKLSESELKNYKDKLREYRKILIDEQVQSIYDKQTTVKIEKQFQKILSDYNSVLYDLEILKDENLKLITVQTQVKEENEKELVEMEKYFNDEKKVLDNTKADLLEERLHLQMEKKIVLEEKEKLEAEKYCVSLEKEKIVEERKCLSEERASLDQQSKLYEAEKETLQKEKIFFQKQCEDLTQEINYLGQKLNDAFLQSRTDSSKLKDKDEYITVCKIQMEMHQKEFNDMCITLKNLQDQLQYLSMENLKLRTENDRLGGHDDAQS